MKDLYAIKASVIWARLKGESASFWLICFYLFLEYVRPQSIYPELDVLPYAFITIVLAFIAYLFEANHLSVKNVENKLIVFFLLTVLLSSVLAYSPADSYANLQSFATWFVIYYLIIHIVNTEQRFLIFFLSFLIYNFKMSQHGFLSWALIGFQFRDWGVTGGPGWFHNSGEFGIELCIFIPLSIYFVLALYRHWGRLKLLVFLLLPFTAIASVIATSSRGALLGASAALLWMVGKSKVRTKALGLISIVAVVAYSYVPPEQQARLQASGEDATSIARLVRWKAGIEIMNDHPFIGIGHANWMPYYRDFYPQNHTGLSHNIFIDAGAELGYTGLMLFCLMILYTLVNNYRTRKLASAIDNRFIFYTAHGLDAALIGFIISASFVSVLYYPYFWINMAFTVALNNIANKEFSNAQKAVQDDEHDRAQYAPTAPDGHAP
jgi:O-antigen ligase